MDGRRHAARLLPAVLTAAALGLLACATAPPAREADPSPAPTPAPQESPAPPPAETPAETPPDGAVSAPVRGDAVIVVVAGGEDPDSPKSLVEAAKAERERRAQAPPPAISVNDANLATYAGKGQITFAEPGPDAGAPAQPPIDSSTEALLATENEWRQGILDRRIAWRQAYDDIRRLEQEAAELRQKFYLEDDTFRRDTQIKPEWDRVLERLQRARVEETQAQQAVAEFLEAGHRAGALPGWLREGIEVEPQFEKPKKAISPLKAIEPQTVEPIDPPRNGAP